MRRTTRILVAVCALSLIVRASEAQSPAAPSSYYQLPAANQRRTPPADEAPTSSRPPLKLAPRTSEHRPGLPKPAAPTAGGALGTVAGSLGIVLGLFFVLVWFSRRFSPAGQAQLPKEA